MTAARDLITRVYELPVTSEAMSPRYQLGDRMLVNPDVRPRMGDDVLLARDAGNGKRETVVGRLLRATPKSWRLRQLSPNRSAELDRRQWPKAELIVGLFHRR